MDSDLINVCFKLLVVHIWSWSFVSFALANHLLFLFDYVHSLKALSSGLTYFCTEHFLFGLNGLLVILLNRYWLYLICKLICIRFLMATQGYLLIMNPFWLALNRYWLTMHGQLWILSGLILIFLHELDKFELVLVVFVYDMQILNWDLWTFVIGFWIWFCIRICGFWMVI